MSGHGSPVYPRMQQWFQRCALGAGALAGAIGAAYLAAWLGGAMAERGVGTVTMKTNTALCLLLLSTALVLLVPQDTQAARRWLARACAAMVLVVGTLSLSEIVTGCDLGIDQLLAQEPGIPFGVTAPNRMGTPAATSFTLLGLAFLALSRWQRRGTCLAQGLGLAVCLTALLSITGYLYGVKEFYGIARYTGIALPAAVSLLLLGLGLLCARPAEGLMRAVTADDPGGASIRRLLLPAVLVPLGLGWLRLIGQRYGHYETAMGTEMFALVSVVIFSALAYISGRRVSESAAAMRRIAQFPDENPYPVLRIDGRGTVLYANQASSVLSGRWCCQIGQQAPEPLVRLVQETMKAGQSRQIDVESDGKVFAFLLTPIAQSGYVNLYGQDITERKQAQKLLEQYNAELEQRVAERTAEVQKEHQRFHGVLNALPVYVVLLDPDYRVPFANHFFEERFGKSNGRRCYEYLFNRSEPCENCETYKVLKTNAPHRWEWTGPDGRNYDIYDFPFTDVDGSPLIMEVGLDITERKRAEAAVQAERQRLYDVLETLPAMICLLTPDYHVAFANRSFRERFGDSQGRHCYEQCFGRAQPCDFCESYDVLKTGQPHHWEVSTPDGTAIIAAHDFPFTDVDGSPLILEMDLDITEHRRAEAALKELNETLEQKVAERTDRLKADLAALTRMHALSGRLLETGGLQPLLQEIMDAAVAIMGAQKGTLQLLEGDSLRLAAHHDHREPFLAFFASAETRASVCGEATKRGKRVIIPDVEESPLFAGTASLAVLREAGVRAVQSTPLVSRGGALLGILTTQWSAPYLPDEHDLWRIDLLARQAADLIERQRAEEQIRRYNLELEQRVADRTAELVKAGKEVRAERQRFLDMLDTLPVIIDIIRADYRIEWANRAYREALGDNQGRLCFESQFGIDKPCEECEAFIPLKTGQPHHWEWTLPSGRTFDIYNFPFTDAAGSPAILEMDIDITERRRAEAALKDMNETLERRVAERTADLRQSEQRFRTMADAMPQLAWIANADGWIHWYNRRWYEYTGTTPEQMEGWGWQSVHDPRTLPAVLERWKASIATGEPFEMTFPLRGADGVFRPFLTRSMPLKDEQGRVVQWFGTNTDITEQKRAEEDLDAAKVSAEQAKAAAEESARRAEAANAAKDRFIATLSHELRTPLTPTLMIASARRDDPGLPEELRQDMETICHSISLEARLIDDLLEITHIATGKLLLRQEPTELTEVVREATRICANEVTAKGLHLTVDTAGGPYPLLADAARLHQVFWNLLKNAIKFTPPGGSIAVHCTRCEDRAGAWARVTVTDTGLGIDAEFLPRIFLPFEQGRRVLTDAVGGLGLGLSIAKAVVDMHGGRISASSDGPGKGAAFTVDLPLHVSGRQVPAHSADPSPAKLEEPRSPARRLRVLLVEDHDDTLRVLDRALKRRGHEVHTARNLATARDLVAQHDFDLLISDLGLPDGNGLELMRELRAGGHMLPGIAVTGFGQQDDVNRSREAGFNAHMTKPVDLEQFNTAIAAVVN